MFPNCYNCQKLTVEHTSAISLIFIRIRTVSIIQSCQPAGSFYRDFHILICILYRTSLCICSRYCHIGKIIITCCELFFRLIQLHDKLYRLSIRMSGFSGYLLMILVISYSCQLSRLIGNLPVTGKDSAFLMVNLIFSYGSVI